MQEYVLQSQRVLKHLSGWGFPSDVQQRIGALAVLWGVFETSLESALWALKGENVKGVRPFHPQIKRLLENGSMIGLRLPRSLVRQVEK